MIVVPGWTAPLIPVIRTIVGIVVKTVLAAVIGSIRSRVAFPAPVVVIPGILVVGRLIIVVPPFVPLIVLLFTGIVVPVVVIPVMVKSRALLPFIV